MFIYTVIVFIITVIGLLLITRRVKGTVESVKSIGITQSKQKLVVGFVDLKGKRQKKTIYKGGRFYTAQKYRVGDSINIRVLRWK
jgi:hypothetical protein